MKIFQVFLFCLILPLSLHAGSTLRIDIGNKKTSIHWIGEGRRVSYWLSNQESFDETIHGLFQQFMPDGGEILLYAHSMLGDAPGYSDYAEWIVRKYFQEDKLLIILDWGGWNPLYHAQLQLARDKARVLAHILDAIEPIYAIHILSHSMGSDLIRIALLESSTVTVHTWILLAPDIARDDFTRDLPVLQHHVKWMAIFTARRDPFLTLAKILRKEPVLRLGDRSQLEVSFYETEHFGSKLIKHGAWLVCQDMRDALIKEIKEN